MRNTHSRRRRDSTVELSHVGVGGVYWTLVVRILLRINVYLSESDVVIKANDDIINTLGTRKWIYIYCAFERYRRACEKNNLYFQTSSVKYNVALTQACIRWSFDLRSK